MKERQSRLNAIRKLIKSQRIESQEDLLGYLIKEGYDVTQATLSRDLKFLKVGKLSDGQTGYVYILPGEDELKGNELIYAQDFVRGYISIDFSGNIVVIKTYSGHADVVSGALDALDLPEVLGTISGNDNCVFACLREGVSQDVFLDSLREKIPQLDI